MAMKAGRVGVARSDVDELGHVTAGGITPEERAKLEKALVSPVSAPLEKELVGVDTTNAEILVKIGDGLKLAGDTSPYTLKASGGRLPLHCVRMKCGSNTVDVTFTMFHEKTTALTFADIYAYLVAKGIKGNYLYPVSGSHDAMYDLDTGDGRIGFWKAPSAGVNYDTGTIYDKVII